MKDDGNQPLPPVIIGIAGGTGSGKTTVALKVCEAAAGKTIRIIHHDSYYHDNSHRPLEERAKINYDHPNAFDTELLVEHLHTLRRGEGVDIPIYDYTIHCRKPETVRVEPADIIFIEGILVLEDEQLRDLMDIRLYVDVDADERFIRRLRRDTSERGRTPESVIEQYQQVVKPMHLQFVAPSRRYAHIIIPEGGYNKVAIDLIRVKILDITREHDQFRSRKTTSSGGDA
ncbi:MAG: uridine kinase [bacterium]